MSGHLCCCTLLLCQAHTEICVGCAWIAGDVCDGRLCCVSSGTHTAAGKVELLSQCWKEDCFILIFVCARERKGLSKGTVCCGAAVIEEGFSKGRGARHSSGGCIYSCLHACSITFTPPWMLPCGISGFSLSWSETDYSTEAVWHCCCRSQTSCIRLTFPVSTMEGKAVNPAWCEWLHIAIT